MKDMKISSCSSFPFMSFMSSLQSSDAQSVAKREEKQSAHAEKRRGEVQAANFSSVLELVVQRIERVAG